MMFASFHSKGTVPSYCEMLNTCPNVIIICSTLSFSIFNGIPTNPIGLCSFMVFFLLSRPTNSGVTNNYHNIFALYY